MSDTEPVVTGDTEAVQVGGEDGEIPERNADTLATGLLEDELVEDDEDEGNDEEG